MNDVHPAFAEDARTGEHAPVDLAATIASRICHDLVSPLGAIANGVELLLLSGAGRTPEMELISESVESANARMRFFRLAFGAANGHSIGRAEVVTTLRGLERGSRFSFDWKPTGDHPRLEIKAIFLLMQCLETAMPLGGRIRVARGPETWEVIAEATRLRIDPVAWHSLGAPHATLPVTAATVQFAILTPLLQALGRQVRLEFEAERITARL